MKTLILMTLSSLWSVQVFAQDIHEHNSSQQIDLGSENKKTVYTCPMHPQIKSHEPGKCPICGMDLVLIETDTSTSSSDEDRSGVIISKASRRLAGIETEKVTSKPVFQNIKAVGSIGFDEGRVSTISAYVDGRIEKLYADYTGVQVKKGEHLAEFYSPNLYSAQVEYLQSGEALWKMRNSQIDSVRTTQGQLLSAAEIKLKELGMSDDQLKELKKKRKAKSRLTLVSQVTGTVIEKNAVEGSYVKTGQVIYKVADLSTVWLLLDLFPEETTYLKFGLKVKARIRSAPDQEFVGRISFIDPVIDGKTRTVRVRVEIPNPEGLLKPGDYADASIEVPIGLKKNRSKTYDPDLAGKYISPMHPQIISDKPGNCPICGMKMVSAEEFGYTSDKSDLEAMITVPRDAVLTVGSKSVLFVETSQDHFSLREVTTGQITSSNRVVILDGVRDGETIASSGVFLVDSQMQLSGKTSLMQVTTDKKENDTPSMHDH